MITDKGDLIVTDVDGDTIEVGEVEGTKQPILFIGIDQGYELAAVNLTVSNTKEVIEYLQKFVDKHTKV